MSRNRKSAQDLLEKYVNFIMDEDTSDDDTTSVKDTIETDAKNSKLIAKQAKEKNKKEAEASFLKFHSQRKRTFKSEESKEIVTPTATEPKPRPQRFECDKCAKFFITVDELKNHTKMAKAIRWVCSASGRVAVKRKAPSDDLNDIALPRKKLKQMKKSKKTKFGQ